VFDIGDAVARLLAEVPAPPAPAAGIAPAPPSEAGDVALGAATAPLAIMPPVPAEEPAAGAGFLSARDAIEKLLGQTPPAPSPSSIRMPTRSSMDLEAALQALDTTLGAVPEPAPAPEPVPGPVAEAAAPAVEAAAGAPEWSALPDAALSSPAGPAPEPAAAQPPAARPETASTVKLTAEEIRLAMAAAVGAAPAPEPPALESPAPESPAPESPAPESPAAEPPSPEPSAAPAPFPLPGFGQSQDLLKVMLEQETTQNVTLDQMAAWIDQGRVQEYHLVARQHSDNWIEAGKVPSLRPAFDRVRKARNETVKAAPEPPPAKRGLFSGLFGRN
jgi:hypothetical protein